VKRKSSDRIVQCKTGFTLNCSAKLHTYERNCYVPENTLESELNEVKTISQTTLKTQHTSYKRIIKDKLCGNKAYSRRSNVFGDARFLFCSDHFSPIPNFVSTLPTPKFSQFCPNFFLLGDAAATPLLRHCN